MVCLAQSLQTITTLEASCRFIFAGMCLLFLFMLWRSAGTVWGKRVFQISNFSIDSEALKVFRKYRCHPV
jgi:hypothetical protein